MSARNSPRKARRLSSTDVYKINLDDVTLENTSYRKVLYTTAEQQLVVQSLLPRERIDQEIHNHITQFIKVEDGSGIARIFNRQVTTKYRLTNGSAIVIPAGTCHEIVAGSRGMKLYALYAPPEHDPFLVQDKKP